MDASRPARALSRPAFGSRLPPSIRSRRPPAAGLDEFRGPAPDQKDGLLRPWQVAGSADPGPTAHAILDTRPRSPRKPLREGSARSRPYRRWPTFPEPSSRRRAVTLAAVEQRPGDPRQLVRDRRHDDV